MTTTQMASNERTKDVFEELSWCPEPPLITLPEFDDLISPDHSTVRFGKLPKWLIKAFWTIVGFRSYYKRLPQSLEQHLRSLSIGSLESGLIRAATLTFEKDPRNLGPIERATTLLFALHNLYDDIISGNFEPDRHQGQVMEMRQYLNLFSTCYIMDGGNARIFKSTNTSHLTVIIGGRFYYLRVGALGRETTFKQLRESLVEIVERTRQNHLEERPPSPGILTCAREAIQVEAFSKLQENEANAKSLLALRHSTVVLCLDLDNCPSSAAEAASAAHSGNCGNRWFLSSLQIVVFGNGNACMIANPGAFLPGNTMMRAADEIQRRALKYHEESGLMEKVAPLPPAQELEWKIDEEFIMRANRDLELILDKQQSTFEILGVGRNLFAAHKLPSVPVFTIGLQMAVKRLTDRMVVIGQLLDRSKYRYMLVTQAVVTTTEVMDFVTYMGRGEVQAKHAVALLRKAVNSQLEKCHNERKYLSFSSVFDSFIGGSNKKLQRLRALIIFLVWRLSEWLKLIEVVRAEVLVSHPRIYPSVFVIGRPGIRIPTNYAFWLHYQIHDDKIVMTIAPSTNWAISNLDLVAALQESLTEIQHVVSKAHGNGDNEDVSHLSKCSAN